MAVAAVPAALSIAGAGFGAASTIMKGEGTKAADDYQAQRLQQQAENGRLKAKQTDAVMGEQLNIALGNVQVARAAAHVDPNSPTSVAVMEHNESVGDRQRSISVDNITKQANQDESDAAYMRYAGDQALTMSYLGAAAGVAGSVGKAFGGGSFGFGGGGSGGGTGFSLTGTGGLY